MRYIVIFLTFFVSIATAQTVGWKQLPGPTGGTIRSIEVSSDNTVFAVTPDGHIHIRDNNSKIWTQSIIEGLGSVQPTYLNAIPFNMYLDIRGSHYLCTYLASSGEQISPVYGIYRSTDNGISWTQVLSNASVYTIREAPGGSIYALVKGDGAYSTILRSTNNGNKWDSINSFPFYSADFVIDQESRCYFAIQSNQKTILEYNINSTFYKALTPPSNTPNSYNIPDITLFYGRPYIRFHDESYLIAGDNQFLIRSKTTIQQNSRFPRPLLASSMGILYESYYSANGLEITYSSDTGVTWEKIESPNDPYQAYMPCGLDSGGGLYYGAANGIYKTSDNGKYWKQFGLPVANIPLMQRAPGGGIFVHDSTRMKLGYSSQYVSRSLISNDSGANWYTTDLLPESKYGRFEYDNSGGIYYFAYSADYPDLYSYNVWYADSSAPYSFELQNTYSYMPYSSASYKNKFYILSYNVVLFTSDKGITWEGLDIPTTSSNVTSFSITPDGTFYIGYYPAFYRSVDEGKTWIKMLTPLKNTAITQILFSPGSIILGTSSQGVWRSDDSGAHWDRWDLTTRDTIRTMKIIGNRCYVGTSAGLLSCDVNSNNWKFELFVDEEKPIHQILSLDDKRVYVSVEDYGIWTNDLNLNSVHIPYSSKDNIRVSYDGSGNEKAIYLTLSEQKDITLALYDILGKKIMQIADGVYEHGESIIPFTISSVEAGVYVLLMQSKDGVVSEKMIVTH